MSERERLHLQTQQDESGFWVSSSYWHETWSWKTFVIVFLAPSRKRRTLRRWSWSTLVSWPGQGWQTNAAKKGKSEIEGSWVNLWQPWVLMFSKKEWSKKWNATLPGQKEILILGYTCKNGTWNESGTKLQLSLSFYDETSNTREKVVWVDSWTTQKQLFLFVCYSQNFKRWRINKEVFWSFSMISIRRLFRSGRDQGHFRRHHHDFSPLFWKSASKVRDIKKGWGSEREKKAKGENRARSKNTKARARNWKEPDHIFQKSDAHIHLYGVFRVA